MRAVILFGFVCCLSVGFAEINVKCLSTFECGDNECCLRDDPSQNRCQRVRDKGELCFTEKLIKEKDVYKIMCPCKDGLTCKPNKRDGEEQQFVGRCVEDESY